MGNPHQQHIFEDQCQEPRSFQKDQSVTTSQERTQPYGELLKLIENGVHWAFPDIFASKFLHNSVNYNTYD